MNKHFDCMHIVLSKYWIFELELPLAQFVVMTPDINGPQWKLLPCHAVITAAYAHVMLIIFRLCTQF